jgi:hypothetical protein
MEDKTSSRTAIPLQAVNADELPREKGWTYDEISTVVGSLYLDSRHALKIRDEQFNAVIAEYKRQISVLQSELSQHNDVRSEHQTVVNDLRDQVTALQKELDIERDRNSDDDE